MKKSILSLLLLYTGYTLSAQLAADVLRYSTIRPGGTARMMGVGGAYGALGADFGGLSLNPAGLAMFRSGELMFTPSLRLSKATARLEGDQNRAINDDKTNFGFENLGIVFHTRPSNPNWKTFNVGIGLNRQQNYSRSVSYDGISNGSIMNGFFEEADADFRAGLDPEDLYPFTAGLAWEAEGIYDPDLQDNVFEWAYDFLGNENAPVNRAQKVNTFGRMNELAISFAGNYREKVMIGATIGVPFVNYRLESEYQEEDKSGRVDFFERLTYTDYLSTQGFGINAKFGINVKVAPALRLGAAFHTPTMLGLTDRFSNTMSYEYTGNDGKLYGGDPARSPEGTSDYRLSTPWRAIASGALIVRKLGFLSADVEWVDYSANTFALKSGGSLVQTEEDERILNNKVQADYKLTNNVRLGAEAVLGEFRLRGGVSLLGKPEVNKDGYDIAYSAGVGYRIEGFYLDLGWRRFTGQGITRAYTGAPTATSDNVASDVLMTVGFKF
jgi:hypothetical protein